MGSQNYKDLIVWQKGMDLVVAVYALTEKFPSSERFGLVKQMRNCATSIPSNIAEGSKRNTRPDFRHFLNIAFGSGAELETQVEIAKRLPATAKLNYKPVDDLLNEVMRMLNKMVATFKN